MYPTDLKISEGLQRKQSAKRRAFVKAQESREAKARAFQERMDRVARGLPANYPGTAGFEEGLLVHMEQPDGSRDPGMARLTTTKGR